HLSWTRFAIVSQHHGDLRHLRAHSTQTEQDLSHRGKPFLVRQGPAGFRKRALQQAGAIHAESTSVVPHSPYRPPRLEEKPGAVTHQMTKRAKSHNLRPRPV